MDAKTRRALGNINRAFYDAEARAFSDTRDHPWPGWKRLLPRMQPPLRLLDVGCGNGRFAAFLAEQGCEADYTGLDASQPLLALAHAAHPKARFVSHDLVEEQPVKIPAGPFEWITLFGVTHHIPGEAERLALFQGLSERLSPGGHLVFTSWQFANDERFEGRTLPFDESIDSSQLEPGDHLLQWGADASARRYCHACDAAERERLVSALPLEIVEEFESDGRGDRLNHYTLLQKR